MRPLHPSVNQQNLECFIDLPSVGGWVEGLIDLHGLQKQRGRHFAAAAPWLRRGDDQPTLQIAARSGRTPARRGHAEQAQAHQQQAGRLGHDIRSRQAHRWAEDIDAEIGQRSGKAAVGVV